MPHIWMKLLFCSSVAMCAHFFIRTEGNIFLPLVLHFYVWARGTLVKILLWITTLVFSAVEEWASIALSTLARWLLTWFSFVVG